MRTRRWPWAVLVVAGVAAAVALGAWLAVPGIRDTEQAEPPVPPVPTTAASGPSTEALTTTPPPTSTLPASTTTTTEPEPVRLPGTVPAWTVGQPWGAVEGLTMFRGNPTRTWYGTGPAPRAPEVQWRYPDSPMCRPSRTSGELVTWCGTGWTGQPVVWNRPDGVTELIFGALDGNVHFVDVATRNPTREPFRTGDLIKGSVTLDPDGFPLIYFGSRDNLLRAVALDRPEPTELWSLDARSVRGIWNNDWDGNPVVVDDILYEGGENSWFFAVRLRRSWDRTGLVTVDPEVVFQMPGYTDDLLREVGRNVSIENSPAVFERRVYFANGGGRVVGLDVSNVAAGEAEIVFDYWVGDDVDASLVIDADGSLYVSAELERFNSRSTELGQLIKLDPYADGDPFVWGVPIPAGGFDAGGIWATPALGGDYLYVTTNPGELLVVDTTTGDVVWRDEVGWHAWSSPVIVDSQVIVATCTGELRGYGLGKPAMPVLLWTVQVPSETCSESTPAVWEGRILVGGRDGFLYSVADR